MTLSILLDWLKPLESEPALLPGAEPNPRFADIRVYHPKISNLSSDVLYVSLVTPPPSNADGQLYFVCTEDTRRGNCNCVVLRGEVSQDELYDQLMDCLMYYMGWMRSMNRAIIQDATVQELVDISDEFLGNPLIILDPYYNYIAGSKGITRENDKKFYELKTCSRVDPETIITLINNVNYQRFGSFWEDCPYRVSREVFGATEVFVDFKCNGLTSLCLVMRCSRTAFSQSRLDVLGLFCQQLGQLIRRQENLVSNNGEMDYLIEQFFSGSAQADAIAQAIGLPPRESYFVVAMEKARLDRSLLSIVSMLNGLLPMSRAFTRENQAFAIVTCSQKPNSPTYGKLQMERLESALDMLDSRCGVSNTLNDLNQLRQGCSQAQKAIRLIGKWKELDDGRPVGRLVKYEQVVMLDLLERFFHQEDCACYYPENFMRMLRSDVEKGTNNCEVLLAFLTSGQRYTAVAERLYMHRNSVLYRLKRIQELYDISFDDQIDKLLLMLCCLGAKLFPPGL